MRLSSVLLLAAFLVASAESRGYAAGNPQEGKAIAMRWCASCHVVSPDQKSAASDVPSFATIAKRSPSEMEALAGFLADPHPPMPKLSLTREEIRNLLAYIGSFRR